MNDIQNDLIEQTTIAVEDQTDEPPMYKVLFYNDDFTPREFVVALLVRLFHKTADEATELMWRVHRGKRGVAGVYPREIAEAKVTTATALARENGFPLQLGMEPES